jgi:alpha-galactosidase
MINRYKRFKLVPEVFWLDAGWYIHANEVEKEKNWANTVGNWEVDQWLCNYIGDFMEANGIDYYRQDFNMRIDNFWRENDAPGRMGIREIRHIEGLYAFWDYLLRRFPEAIIDNCASGGRRLDFETMKRSAPMWRTDYTYGEPVGYQTHTYGLSLFLPLTGTGVQKSDRFTFRSSLGTSVIFNWKITDQSSSFTEMQRCFKEFMELRPYYYGEYYPLTSYEDMTADDIWMVYQLHRPSDETGIIVVFRREECTSDEITVRLSALQPGATYKLTDRDSAHSFYLTGEALRNGLTLKLEQPRSSLIYQYERLQ